MEKSAAGNRKFCLGLLVLFFIQVLPFFRASELNAVSWAYIQSLRFRKVDKYFFTATDCSFTVNIENVAAEKVTVSVNDVPEGVSFVSSRKETYMPYSNSNDSDQQYGTRLTLSFRFDRPGAYQIKAIDVRIEESYAKIPVESVYVYENPSLVRPQVSISFEDSDVQVSGRNVQVSAGEHIKFRMYIRYAIQVLDFSWQIPEDSLFREIEHYDISENAVAGEFSPDAVQIALFDWQPLKPGSYDFPHFNINATSFGGISYEVASPSYKIQVLEPKEAIEQDSKDEGIFAYAFASPPQAAEAAPKKTAEDVPLDRLYDLYSSERHSIVLFSAAHDERLALEDELGLTSLSHVPSVPLLILAWVLCIASLAAAAVLFALKKIPHAAVCAVMFVLLLVLGILDGHQVSKRYGLYEGGEIYSIPEAEGGSGIEMQKGSVVLIKHSAAGWHYVVFNDTYGWVPESTVRLIQ